MILFRPVGLAELQRIAEAGFLAFPPRLPHQPIFYPVLNEEYAVQIARDWNTRDEASGYAGFVTRFEVQPAFASRYAVRVVGGSEHAELWVPAEELAELNAHIEGEIRVTAHFCGPLCDGAVDPESHLPQGLVRPTRWDLWRQDDNGSQVRISGDDSREEVESRIATLEARGHKQMYFAREASATRRRRS